MPLAFSMTTAPCLIRLFVPRFDGKPAFPGTAKSGLSWMQVLSKVAGISGVIPGDDGDSAFFGPCNLPLRMFTPGK